MSLAFRGEAYTGNMHLGITSMWMAFKAMRLDKMAEGMKIKAKKREEKMRLSKQRIAKHKNENWGQKKGGFYGK